MNHIAYSDPDKWPEPNVVEFKTIEDAQKMMELLSDIYSRLSKINGELEGQWAHIRNLEEKLLAPGEKLWTSTKL